MQTQQQLEEAQRQLQEQAALTVKAEEERFRVVSLVAKAEEERSEVAAAHQSRIKEC